MLAAPRLPTLAELARLARCLGSVADIAGALDQARLAGAVREIGSFLGAWFDTEQQSAVGVLRPGNEELDQLKGQFVSLPGLLKQVRPHKSPCRRARAPLRPTRLIASGVRGVQIADEEVARVPGWLARVHCPDLCLSCHFCSPSGYLMFCHDRALPAAVLEAALSDFAKWSDEADFGGHEGVFYTCDATRQLNEQVGDLEQRILALEVRCWAKYVQ